MKISKLLLPFVLLLSVFSCKENDVEPIDVTVKNKVVAVMTDWYLWNDGLSAEVDVNDFDSPEALISSLRNAKDKWSSIQEEVAFDQYYVSAEYVGLGFASTWLSDTELRVSLVYKGSPAYEAGLRRGMQILEVNGVPVQAISNFNAAFGADEAGVSVSLKVKKTGEAEEELQMTKAVVDITTVPHRSVIELGNKKVGYVVFNNFIERSKEDLNEAFDFFAAEGVDELVLDLRYNRGGLLNIAGYLSSIIAPPTLKDELLVQITFNEEKADENTPVNFEETPYSFDFDKVVIITTKSSASASEVVINGLKPYLDVKTVGDDSYGKPVGASSFRFDGYVFTPITFKITNADGVAEYFDGIPADVKVPDGLTYDFGDVDEDCLKEALYYIENGAFSAEGKRMAAPRVVQKNEEMYEGINKEIGAF
ncbi:S41 family peptidase [Flammeovirgaceae bacterium SG7u.111]|nr:S41 family peptidase [Flammeovirgaceae bacterium SG7u.132]WPO34948.1 S41 family peptidase [Flammeovirgaceae bacterium SG7u.111]